jgi:hypothetical protein
MLYIKLDKKRGRDVSTTANVYFVFGLEPISIRLMDA